MSKKSKSKKIAGLLTTEVREESDPTWLSDEEIEALLPEAPVEEATAEEATAEEAIAEEAIAEEAIAEEIEEAVAEAFERLETELSKPIHTRRHVGQTHEKFRQILAEKNPKQSKYLGKARRH